MLTMLKMIRINSYDFGKTFTAVICGLILMDSIEANGCFLKVKQKLEQLKINSILSVVCMCRRCLHTLARKS